MEEKEIWKDIVGYEGLYKVSNYGDIISYQNKTPRHIYQSTTNCGYKQVSLHNNGHRKHIGVHVVVAMAFVDGYFEGAEVNHKDLNKTNNYYKNLEWVTRSQNQKHQYDAYHPEYEPRRCVCCGKIVKGTKTRYCYDCELKRRRQNWPSKEYMMEKLKHKSVVQIGKDIGLSDNGVRKILFAYSLPTKRKDIIMYRKQCGTYIPPRSASVIPLSEKYVWYEINGEKFTATGWAKHLGLDHKRFSRYAQKHTYDEVVEYIKSFI